MSDVGGFIADMARRQRKGETFETPRIVTGTWTPTFTGFSVNPVGVYRYVQTGKLCTCFVRMSSLGTSNATVFTLSAPFTAMTIPNMVWGAAWWDAVDNGVNLSAPGLVFIASGTARFTLYKTSAGAAWTASGTKSANFTIIYEVA